MLLLKHTLNSFELNRLSLFFSLKSTCKYYKVFLTAGCQVYFIVLPEIHPSIINIYSLFLY